MKQIYVHNRDLGFWTQEDINIQRFETEDGEKYLVWCNHASAEIEDDTVEFYRPDGPDIVQHIKVEICQKCSAYRQVAWDEYDSWHDEWQEAPSEGVHK